MKTRLSWDWADLALFALLHLLALGVAAALSRWLAIPVRPVRDLTSQMLAYGIWLALVAGWLGAKYGESLGTGVGWNFRPQLVLGAVAAGIGTLLLVGCMAAALKTPYVNTPVADLLRHRAYLVLVLPAICLGGPLVEELFFRGMLQRILGHSLGAPAAIGLTAIGFGLLHGPQLEMRWQNIAVISAAGAVFGCYRHWTNSTFGSWVMHAAYNTTAMAGYLAGKS
jgi:membrane protease YdiL (CAAX protease family)